LRQTGALKPNQWLSGGRLQLKNFFAAARALSPNCNMTQIDNDFGPPLYSALAESVAAPLVFFCVISSIVAPLLPIPWALNSLAVIILQQIEKSQKNGKFIVCL
jgi:hypothetical protein